MLFRSRHTPKPHRSLLADREDRSFERVNRQLFKLYYNTPHARCKVGGRSTGQNSYALLRSDIFLPAARSPLDFPPGGRCRVWERPDLSRTSAGGRSAAAPLPAPCGRRGEIRSRVLLLKGSGAPVQRGIWKILIEFLTFLLRNVRFLCYHVPHGTDRETGST